jgi:FKBP-type peptidyl-prolyl cis-trans isomerase
MRRAAVFLLLIGVVAVAGCGGSGDPPAFTGHRPHPVEPGPNLSTPKGPPTRKLVTRDVKVGSGPAARAGDEVTIQYVGHLWTGDAYADSWRYPHAPSFTLGKGQLIVGFDRGIRGMRPGGRRIVMVPRQLDIFPGAPVTPGASALIFLVDMLKVHPHR